MQLSLLVLVPVVLATEASFEIAERIRLQSVDSQPSSRAGPISFPIAHRQHDLPNGIYRRDNDVPLYNVSTLSYLIELSIGTPGQKVKVAIDTGSDELWVNPDCSTVPIPRQRSDCKQYGRYDASKSSTANTTSIEGHVEYGIGNVTFNYVSDNIALPDSTLELKNVIFGSATTSRDLHEGILGLGYGVDVNLEYPNLIDELFLQQKISSRAFSIALGGTASENKGTLVFGGVDTKKFHGKLQAVPILGSQNGENNARYLVMLTGLEYTASNGSSTKYLSGSSIPVVIDSGSSFNYLPSNVVRQIANSFGATYNSRIEYWTVPCNAANVPDTINFSFGDNVTIRVPAFEFVYPTTTPNVCVLSVLQAPRNLPYLLGDVFMRSGFFVFDQTNKAIYMAQYADCGEDEREIPKGGKPSDFGGQCTKEDVQKAMRNPGYVSGGTGTEDNLPPSSISGALPRPTSSAPPGNDNHPGNKSIAVAVDINMAAIFSLVAGVAIAFLIL